MVIASLVVRLEADAARFIDNTEKAARHMEAIGRRIVRAGTEITKLFSPVTATFIAAFTAAVRQSAIVHGELAQAWDHLTLSARLLLREIGGALTPAFERMIASKEALIQKARQLVEWFKELSPHTQDLIVKVGLFLAVLGPTVVIIGSVVRAVGALWSILAGLASVVLSVVTAVGAFLVENALLIGGILIVVAAVALLIRHWDLVKDGASVAWNFIVSVVLSAIDKILDGLQRLFAASGWDSMMDKVADLRSHLAVLKGEADAAEAAAKKLWHAYSTPLLPDWIRNLPQTLGNLFKLPKLPPLPTLPLLQAQDVLAELDTQLRENAEAAQLFGGSFNLASANANAYKAAIDELLKQGVALDAVLNNNGLTLRQLGESYRQLEVSAALTQSANAAIGQSFVDLATIIGQVIGGAIKTFKGLEGALLGLIGKVMTTLGSAMIMLGTAKLIALGGLNPFGLITYGAALVAFGTALSAASNAIGNGPSAGGGGGSAPAASSSAAPESNSQGAGTLVLELHGDGVIGALFADPRNQDALAGALSDLSGRNVVVVPVAG